MLIARRRWNRGTFSGGREIQVEERPTDEDRLIERARQGDLDAYGTLIDTYQTVALKTAYVFTGSAADAEEVVQDAFIKAFRRLGGFRRGAPFRPWFLAIVANEARDRWRALARRKTVPFDVEGVAVATRDAAPPLAEVERRDELAVALRELSAADRDIIACRFFLDLSEADTATVLGIRRGTVKSRITRALERLRLKLEATRV
jgi:RNA polymerase sigma-70 factor (ECF subfamily)